MKPTSAEGVPLVFPGREVTERRDSRRKGSEPRVTVLRTVREERELEISPRVC
jgi:hypothetical protein